MEETRTPNLYLAAYLVDAGEQILDCVPMDMYPDRALFVFKASKRIPFLVNKFIKGESRVEPRSYSLMIKDLKAKAQYDLQQCKERKVRNLENTNVPEQVVESSLVKEEVSEGRVDERDSCNLDAAEEAKTPTGSDGDDHVLLSRQP
jgi:hypothetical protein